MLNHRSPFMTLSIVALALAACTPKAHISTQEIQTSLQGSLVANAVATSESDWHASPSTPENIFANWNSALIEKKVSSSDVCAALAKIDDKDLALFEDEIRASRNVALLQNCQQQVAARLDGYWAAQRQSLKVNTSNFLTSDQENFQFADNIQYRDTSNGYVAVHGDVGPKEVVLTFDDGPSGQYTPMILKTLERVNAKAIFFEMGKNVKQFPQVSKMVAAGGHSIGGHSLTHRCLANKPICQRHNGYLLTFQQATDEIAGSLQDIYDAVGWVDPFFRFPYGEVSPDLRSYLQQNGIGEFIWSIDSEDWKNKSSQAVIDDTMRQIRARGKGIVLFHDIQHKTAEALPQFLKILHDEGYQPVLLKPAHDQDRFDVRVVNVHPNQDQDQSVQPAQ